MIKTVSKSGSTCSKVTQTNFYTGHDVLMQVFACQTGRGVY